MKTLALPALMTAALALATASASAGTIPYPSKGTVAPTASITASTTGDIIGSFVGYSASDTDEIRLVDLTSGFTSAYFFTNNATAAGTTADFGSVTAGDTLAFEIYNEDTGKLFSSDPALSADGTNHAYVTGFSGGTLNGVTYASGNYTYVGMEDLTRAVSDQDYNDDQFLFTNVSSNATPEPQSFVLLGTGLIGVAGSLRRKLAR